MDFMKRIYTAMDADELGRILMRREKILRDKRCRKNVKDFIGLLSHYIQHAPIEQSRATGGLYEHITKKHDGKPCGSYAVSIAIEKLPGDFKTNSKKQKQ